MKEELQWEEYRRACLWRCCHLGASHEDAEDCAHEALRVLVEKLAAASPANVVDPLPWVTTVAQRRYIDLVRKRDCERRNFPRLCPESPGLVDDMVVGHLEAVRLVHALNNLPTTTRDVCVHVGRGLGAEEVAILFGISRRSVDGHLARARRYLRKLQCNSPVAITVVRQHGLDDTTTRDASHTDALTDAS